MAKQREQVGSVQRAMEILDLFGRRQHELATTEIPCAMKLRMSTFAGLIYPSKSAAIPARVLKNRKLHLGFSLAEIAGVLLRQFSSNAFRMRK